MLKKSKKINVVTNHSFNEEMEIPQKEGPKKPPQDRSLWRPELEGCWESNNKKVAF